VPNLQTPGVYYERADASAPAISAIRTDIAAFVGIARRGPLHTPVPVQSWRQFMAYFGDFTGAGFLAYAVRAFFENGGRRCWVVRVASPSATTAQSALNLFDGPGIVPTTPGWTIQAFSPGVWGNELTYRLAETHRGQGVTDPQQSTPTYATVPSLSGFGRFTLVRLLQDSAPPQYRVINDIDPLRRRLLWQPEHRDSALPYDAPLSGLDLQRPIVVESVEYTLSVFQLGRLLRVYEGLTTIPEDLRYGPTVIASLRVPDELSLAQGIPLAPEPVVLVEERDPEQTALFLRSLAVTAGQPQPLSGGADGLSLLSTYDFVGEASSPLDSDLVKSQRTRGLRALDPIREVAVVAIPDIHIQPVAETVFAPLPDCVPDPCLPAPPPSPAKPPPRAIGDLPPRFSEAEIYLVQAALVQHCEEHRDRFALLDAPFAAARDDALGVSAALDWRSRFDSKYAAFYYPWVRVVDPLRTPTSLTRDIPPSGHAAGQFAATDLAIGVHKAPANAPLIWIQDVTVPVDDATHGLLNPYGINAIRTLPGRGIRIFGARTVSSDPAWRYVNVRRLLMMIEKAVDLATQWAVFEPNDLFTRAKLQLTLTSFLVALWQRGALVGSTVQEAFFVRCDDSNNPADGRERGQLLAEVGVAPSLPFEFIVLRVERTANAFEIAEQFGSYGGI